MNSIRQSLPAVFALTALTFATACADNRNALRREHEEEQNKLAMQQADEQRKLSSEQNQLAQRQTDEQMKLDEKQAREDYTAFQKEQAAVNKRAEANQEKQRELARKAFEACEKLPVESLDICPLQPKSVQTLTYIDEGVAVGLKPGTGEVADIERHVECFKARQASRAAQSMVSPSSIAAESSCLVMFPNVDVKVTKSKGQVAVNLQTDDKERVAMLRDRARQTLVETNTTPRNGAPATNDIPAAPNGNLPTTPAIPTTPINPTTPDINR
ncbi:MAG: hypothetical protein K1X64_18300 [Myxococcaceae bacterium]|nr:hypothetical protein [Myxococcaceae bacterium]